MTMFAAKSVAVSMILDIGSRLSQKNYLDGNDANISMRFGFNEILTLSTGIFKDRLDESLIVTVDINGKLLKSVGCFAPSSDTAMHLAVYRENPQILGIINAQPPVATAYAVAGEGFDRAILPRAAVHLGNIPVAPYAMPGSKAAAETVAPFCREHNGVLLENRGAMTWGSTLFDAYSYMESIEQYALTKLLTENLLNGGRLLKQKDVGDLLDLRAKLAISRGGVPKSAEDPEGINT